jgi:hypothetical protein
MKSLGLGANLPAREKVISMVIETSEQVEVRMVCDSAECEGLETDHDSTTVAYWETPDSGTLVARKTCRRCSRTTAVQQRVGPPRPSPHDCAYYADVSGACNYCPC